MIRRFWPQFLEGSPAVGLLFLRLFVGYAMMMHGWSKIQKPFGWMGEGAPVPSILQALAALSEFGGGLALIVGFLTPLASLGIMSTMFVACLSYIKKGAPLIGQGGAPSYELPALFFVTTLCLLLAGPGKLSLDALLFNKKKGGFGRY